jgi:nucleoside 2-deoxyribosyltransferase
MVLGSIGYGGVEEIRRFYSFLKMEGFDTLDHISQEGMDYSKVKDFRNSRELSRRIVEHDLRYVRKADVLVVLSNQPSYGTAIEMYVAKKAGKKVVLFAPHNVPTPWPVNFSDFVATSKKELLTLLRSLEGVNNQS